MNQASIKNPRISPYIPYNADDNDYHHGDGISTDNNKVEIGPTALAYKEWNALELTLPNIPRMRNYRFNRLQQEIRKRNLAGLLLFDPLNIRYATDTSNMQLWVTHNPCRACFVPAEGTMILWDFHNCEHLSAHLPLVGEIRHGASFFYFETGNRGMEKAQEFAKEIADIVDQRHSDSSTIAVDKIEINGLDALRANGLSVIEGQEVTELARAIKGEDDIAAMICAIRACEAAMHEMHEVAQAGLSENDIWSVLHAGNIKRGGEWIETRLLSSGPRTNPWYQESGPRIIQDGDILAFDTDLIGCYGMCCDISRTWKIGDKAPTDAEKDLYKIAYEHIQYNMALLQPGRTFHELTSLAHRLPTPYRQQRYGVVYHGVGLCDEYPSIRYPEDLESYGYEGELEPGMVLCVEAYIGAVGGSCGVKLEEQVLITEHGYKNLTAYPFAQEFLT